MDVTAAEAKRIADLDQVAFVEAEITSYVEQVVTIPGWNAAELSFFMLMGRDSAIAAASLSMKYH